MRYLLLATLLFTAFTITTSTTQAQSKDELNELLNSESAGTKSSKSKSKAKQESKPAANREQPSPQPPAQTPVPVTEQPKTIEVAPAKSEEKKPEPSPAAEPAKPAAKQAPVQEPTPAVTESPKQEPKAETPAQTVTTSQVKSGKTEMRSASGEKLKELPDPQSIGWRKNRRIGDKLIQMGSVYNALHYYEAAMAKKPTKTILYQKLADGNFALRDYRSANKYYKMTADADSVKRKNLYSIYQLALTHKYLGNYTESKATFEQFNKLASKIDELAEQRRNASREAQGCDLALQLKANTDMPAFKVEHIGENINQPFTDYAPILKDANTMLFGAWVSDKVILENKREKYADFSRIYTATKSGNTWGKAQQLQDAVNTVNFHTGNPTLTPDGKTMYYTQCFQDEMSRMRCSIYKSTLGNAGWSTGEKLDANVNQEGATTTHPAVGKNEAGELGLFFASDRNLGKGMDIFFAKMNSSGFDKARTVASINTKGDEMTPYFDFSTGKLYFSSNGQINIGGADVFVTEMRNGEWAEPQHLGLPVNSSVDDMYFYWNDKLGSGFVVSNRPGGFGLKSETCCDDIYEVGRTRLYFAVKGTLLNTDSGNTAIDNALVTLYNARDGKQLKTVYSTNGQYFFDLDPETEYKIISRKNGFEDMMLSVSTAGKRTNDTMTLNFTMKMIPKPITMLGQLIGTVYWQYDRDNLTNGAPDTLNKVVEFINSNPQYVLEIGSHTDSKGTEEYNLKLSERRSLSVMKYLMSKKVKKFHLESKAYGESQPVAPNENPDGSDNPDGRAKNRRTEFKVVKELTSEQLAEKEAQEKTGKPASKK